MKKVVSLLLAVMMVLSIFASVPVSVGAADTNTVYLINSANWSDVHAYAWNGGDAFGENAPWPGQAMQSAGTHSSGAQMYSITFPSAYENIIFNGSGNQTDDLGYQGGMGYDNGSGQWVTVDNPTPGPTPTPGGSKTVYFMNNWMWTDVKVYYWGSTSSNSAEWPGDTPVLAGNNGTYDVYSATVPSDIIGIIFNGFDGGINANNQTPDIFDSADGDCYSMVWDGSTGVTKEPISNILPDIGPVTPTTPTPGDVYVVAGDAGLCGVAWDPADTSNQMTKTSGGSYEKVFTNVAAGTYEFKVVQGTTWGVEYNLEGIAAGEDSNASVTVDKEGATVTVGFDGSKAYVNVTGGTDIVPTEPIPTTPVETQPVPTTPVETEPVPTTPIPTTPVETEPSSDLDPNKAYVLADGKYYEVTQGQKFTYNYCISVDSAIKVGSLDVETRYDKSGLKFLPAVDEYGDVDASVAFPKLTGVIYNFDVEGQLLYNYSNISGVRMPNNTVVFNGTFEVTASKGVFNIDSKMKTLADTNLNVLVYNFETLGDFADSEVLPELTPYEPTNPDQPTTPVNPTTPAPTTPVEPGKVYVKADGVSYEVKKGDVFTYIFNVGVSEKISAIDVETNYDGSGLEFVPATDEYGDVDMGAMFPVLQSVIYNFDLENKLLYNYSAATGIRLPASADGTYTDKNKVFVGQFKVTADSGVYEISSRIKTLGDEDANKIIFNYEQIDNTITVTQKDAIEGGSVVEPTTPVETQPKPTTPTPTNPTPTSPSGDVDPNKVYVKADGNYYEVKKGDKVTYNYRISVDSAVKISSLDATTFYDAKGLKFIPAVDEYGDVDITANFPKLTGPIYNFDIEGKLLYNYSNISGVRMANNSVVFSGTFEVTASTGVYEINSVMNTLADTDLNKIVYKGEKIGEYAYDQILVGLTPIKPSVDPTNPTPTNPQPTKPVTEKTYVVADGVKYEVAQGQEITYTYYMSHKNKIGSLDIKVKYDKAGLEYINTVDEYGDDDLATMFPVLQSVIYNPASEDGVLYNYSNVSGVRFPVAADGKMTDKNIVFVGKFKVVGGPGTYEINTHIETLADTDLNVLYYLGNKTEGAEVNIESVLDVPELPTVPDEDDVLYGDVNGDGKVSIFDVSYVQKHVAGYEGYEELDARAFKAADVNFDGKVSIFDASRIQKFIAGYFDSFI